jgi:predicted nucleic acid-binding protein
MARFVIDPPTLVHLCESDGTIDPAHQLVAPNSVRSQALDLLLQRVRAGALSKQEALALHERMTETKMRLLGDRVSRRTAWMLALEHGWSSIEAAEYLAVAQLQADALITLSPALASMATGIVPLGEVGDLFSS